MYLILFQRNNTKFGTNTPTLLLVTITCNYVNLNGTAWRVRGGNSQCRLDFKRKHTKTVRPICSDRTKTNLGTIEMRTSRTNS